MTTFAYHIASPTDRDSIVTNGIDSESHSDEFSGNWLWLDLSSAKGFGGRSQDIWRVDIAGLDVEYETLIYADCVRAAVNIWDPIPVDRLHRLT